MTIWSQLLTVYTGRVIQCPIWVSHQEEDLTSSAPTVLWKWLIYRKKGAPVTLQHFWELRQRPAELSLCTELERITSTLWASALTTAIWPDDLIGAQASVACHSTAAISVMLLCSKSVDKVNMFFFFFYPGQSGSQSTAGEGDLTGSRRLGACITRNQKWQLQASLK